VSPLNVAGHERLTFAEHGRLVLREGRSFEELAVDLTVELPDGPSTTKGLLFIEVPRLRAAHREQTDVVRPGERESRGDGRNPAAAGNCPDTAWAVLAGASLSEGSDPA